MTLVERLAEAELKHPLPDGWRWEISRGADELHAIGPNGWCYVRTTGFVVARGARVDVVAAVLREHEDSNLRGR